MPLFLMRPTTGNYEFTHKSKFWTQEIPTRKYFGPTKYPREKILDPRRHDGTRHTRPMMARDPRNLAHLFYEIFVKD